MDNLLFILILIGIIAFSMWIISIIINSATNTPTWQGIIVSALIGMLPLYLFLCWMGWMGEEKK